ncbi:uncharacterized protein K452DRAFT_285410 [Aplosporella prunicola CBS 121167]|uniref:Uncharacterized protein n=1 Tax=Aplosporella prunicola CBS 121167 TaxID=1176127 RepID=A0A6A6BNN6_9PEZI|nr:uncharacterized protein K452DRAFT_285410 [Aplosporella prunicola CBS 121167]KAF2144171.1 hypothetical protein K452DRAFT_285410 [Aplosporella prunicola CBS 121167]
MPPDSSSFTALNVSTSAVPEWMGSFTLSAQPNTDLWRKPPSSDTSTCPILFTALRNPFVAAEVTVSADWELEWDQAGLVIFAGAPPGRIGGARPAPPPPAPAPVHADAPPAYVAPAPASKWVKVGLEFSNNACHATSVCATADGADWALTALPSHRRRRSDLRIKMERIGYALWVWYEDEVSGWKKLREVTWFFWGVEDKAVRVGVYASRPANLGATHYERRHGGPRVTQRNLLVEFEGLEIF